MIAALLLLLLPLSAVAAEPAETGGMNPPGAVAGDAIVLEYQVRYSPWHPSPAVVVELAAIEECRIYTTVGLLGLPQQRTCSWVRTAWSNDATQPWGFTLTLTDFNGTVTTINRTGNYNSRQVVPDAVFDLGNVAFAIGCVMAFGVGYIGGRQR